MHFPTTSLPLLLSLCVVYMQVTCSRAVGISKVGDAAKSLGNGKTAAAVPGWKCFVQRRYLCEQCLSPFRSLTCKGILLQGRSFMRTTPYAKDMFPTARSADYVKLSGGRPLCAGFLSHLLSDRACSVPVSTKALQAEGLARVAEREFGGLFEVVRTKDGRYVVKWIPTTTKAFPVAGRPTVLKLTQQSVIKLWASLFQNSFHGACTASAKTVRKEGGGWRAVVTC